jgi:hypothetical protein
MIRIPVEIGTSISYATRGALSDGNLDNKSNNGSILVRRTVEYNPD